MCYWGIEEQKNDFSSKWTSFAFCETKQMEILHTITSNHTLNKKGFMCAHVIDVI